MTFEEILDQALAMLQRRRRATYRTQRSHEALALARELAHPYTMPADTPALQRWMCMSIIF